MNEAVRENRKPVTARARAGGFNAWREHHGWSMAASFRRLASRPLGTALTVAVMGFAMSLPLAFFLLLANVQRIGDSLGKADTISVFLKGTLAAPNAQQLADILRERRDIGAVEVVTPKEGLDEMARAQGFAGAIADLDNNPLPFVLKVHPKPGLTADQVGKMVQELRDMGGVDMVQDNGGWRARLDALVGVGTRAVTVLAVLLGIAALLVVGNTIRVDIQGRAAEIGVLLLIGASRPFIRRPYLYAGLWYGLFAGILAVVLALGLQAALAGPVARLADAYGGSMDFGGLPAWLLLAVPLLSAFLGWLGARLVSARQLRKAP
ncbi:permease-like cell division protein FtsX [Pinirhizobacter soli]|uniref:permease-like cell division protein FtsX n=1 Tax=Pinirhizobacter soli TaxID=2786953 RepID=UPI00202A8EF1|nr:permease-like cell division protein FtsX [Pinirhizobacter soli]